MNVFALPALLCLLVALAGCTPTSGAVGVRTAETANPVRKLVIFVREPYLEESPFRDGAREHIGPPSPAKAAAELSERMVRYFPAIFEFNHIETKAFLIPRGKDQEALPLPEGGYGHALDIGVSGASLSVQGNSAIHRFRLVARVRKADMQRTTWAGTLDFVAMGGAGMSDLRIEEFAANILDRLAADGIIRLEGGKARVPPVRSPHCSVLVSC